MKLKGLDGKEYNVSVIPKQNTNASKNHLNIRDLLKEMYPYEIVVEEFKIPGTRLFCDFFLPSKKLVIEVHGEQHYTYNPHFFKSKKDFYQAKARDNTKEEWVLVNKFELLVLSYKEKMDECRAKIIDRLTD